MKRSLLKCTLIALAAVLIFGSSEASADTPAKTYKALGKVKIVNKLERQALNPQPLPPRYYPPRVYLGNFDRVYLNPQPLPPRWNLINLVGRVR